jgi:hypothetical protein
MNQVIQELRNSGIQGLRPIMASYFLGMKHGISWADVEHHYQTQIKQIDELLAALKENDGQEIAAQDHPRP